MKYIIKEMTNEEKPREKLLARGSEALLDYELLAIILRTGTKEKSVIDLSIELMKEFKSFYHFQDLTYRELLKIKGIGNAKAIEILAVIEFCKRLYHCNDKKVKIRSSKEAFLYFKSSINFLKQEHFVALYLSCKNDLICDKVISIGSLNQTIASPRDVIMWGIKYGAFAVIVIHNHPSGDCSPSYQDTVFTNDLIKSCNLVSLKYVDHIIIGNNSYYSYKLGNTFYLD